MGMNTGGPAFPGLHPSKECHYQDSGMRLRDYFAAKAMQAILTNHKLEDCDDFVVASNAYQMADFMLKARET
jgi:hypothetical protein